MDTRAVFDFVVSFTNGGSLRGEGFRLDLPRPDATEQEIAALLVAHLGLLMVGEVELRNLRRVEEPHRGSRGVPRGARAGRRLVDLSHPIHHGLVTYPGLPAPEISRPPLARGLGGQVRRPASPSRSAASAWWPTPARTWTARGTGTPTERTSPAFRSTSLVDLEGVLLRATGSGRRGIDVLALAPLDVRGKAVLLHTGWDVALRHARSTRRTRRS